ncbi:MAG: hypothetical protein PHG66_04295 [Candidatus Colwellbacteria bacterium]|nr:hypothetical protein [Candidatus Colwellbacteria bacterium]
MAALSVIWVAIGATVVSVLQYNAWAGNAVSKYLLPPHRGIDYFFYYVGTRYYLPFGVSLIFAALFAAAMIAINKRSKGKFFDGGEIAIASTAIFLSGYPGVLIFLPVLIVLYLICHIFLTVRGRKGERIPLFYLWLPVSISVILINNFWFSGSAIWRLIKF